MSHAKLHNNVFRQALLKIPPAWVCIPALHLDLCVSVWMFEVFLSDMRQLDMRQLDTHLTVALGEGGMHTSDNVAFAEAAGLSGLQLRLISSTTYRTRQATFNLR